MSKSEKQTLSPSLSHNGEGDAELGGEGKAVENGTAPAVELRLCMTKAVNGWVIEEQGGDMRVVEGSAQTRLGHMLMTNIEGLLATMESRTASVTIVIC